MISFIKKKWQEHKVRAEKKKILRENGCICYCKSCHSILRGMQNTEYEGIYSYECNCGFRGYFDYCHPCPLHVETKDLDKWVQAWGVV